MKLRPDFEDIPKDSLKYIKIAHTSNLGSLTEDYPKTSVALHPHLGDERNWENHLGELGYNLAKDKLFFYLSLVQLSTS